MDTAYVVGIGGGSGSGKTTLARRVLGLVGGECEILSFDSYYNAHHELSLDERRLLDYDAPEAFDVELFCEHVSALKRGEGIGVPVYDFAIYDRTDMCVPMAPAPIILLEGIMVLTDERVRRLMDLIVYVDVDADVRVLRRLRRDVKERGRTVDSVITQYLKTVRPAHAAYVEPCKYYADLIVPGGGDNIAAAEMIAAFLSLRLGQS